jgi:hypothetical protein
MSAMSFKKPPPRLTLTLSAAATLVAAAAFALTTTTAPSAQATTNRRLCTYVNGEHNAAQKITRYVVVNYKKDGACPSINPDKHPDLISYANPVPKETCEELSADVEFESKYYTDVCDGLLKDDIVYVLSKPDDKKIDPNANIFNLGNVGNFS